ncbi:unnamed protein product, partial [Linum tenue]
ESGLHARDSATARVAPGALHQPMRPNQVAASTAHSTKSLPARTPLARAAQPSRGPRALHQRALPNQVAARVAHSTSPRRTRPNPSCGPDSTCGPAPISTPRQKYCCRHQDLNPRHSSTRQATSLAGYMRACRILLFRLPSLCAACEFIVVQLPSLGFVHPFDQEQTGEKQRKRRGISNRISSHKMSKVDEGVSSELNDENQQRKEKVYLSSRCGVQEFSGLIDSLSDDKKHLIEDMGFGGLLHLKKHKLKLKLCEELMMRFDVTTSQLNVHGNRLTLRVDDVVTILGLHGGGMDVDTNLGEGDEVRVRFNLGYGQIKCSNLKTDMMKDLTVGEEFRGKFLLYSMSRLLRPSTAVYVPNNYLRILGNIDDVGNLNWAKFVYDGLLEGIKDYQNKLEGTSREQSVTGCILLLEIFYLEHVNMHNVTRHSSSLPRIRHWDDKSIGTIVKKVSSLGGVDSIQVEFGRDGASCFTIEDVTAQIVQLRNEFQQEMHSTKSQIGDLKKEMSDSMSQIITKLSSIESHLETKAANKTIEDEAVQVRTKKGELNDDAIAHEKTFEEVRTGADHTISEENMTTNEDSTNVYDKLNNMARDFKAKEDFVELSDDASSLLKASTPKGNHLVKQGNRRSGAISSQNEKKRKANQHEEDETDSFEALMAGVDQKIRSREDSNMGLRKKEVLKAGPQFQFPYVADKPAVRGRGRQQGPKQQGTKKGGRSKKKLDDDWENKIYLPICEHEHWYLAIVNMEIKEVYLLDSYALKDDSPRKEKIRQILSVLDEMLHHDNFEGKSEETIPLLKTFEVKSIPVLQQPNT